VQDGRAEWSYVEHGHFSQTSVGFQSQLFPPVLLSPPSVWSVVHQLMYASPEFRSPPTAANQGCGDAMTSGRTCPLVVLSLLRLSSNLEICIHCKNSHP